MASIRTSLLTLTVLAVSGCSSMPDRVTDYCGLQCSKEASRRTTSEPLDYYAHIAPAAQAAMRDSAALARGQAVNGSSAGVNAPPQPVSAYGALGASGIVQLARCKIDRAGTPRVDECYALLPEKVRADLYAIDHTTFVNQHTVVILVSERPSRAQQ